MRKNPAVWISIVAALLALAVSFGVRISGTQIEAIVNLAELAIPLIIVGGGVAIRSQVYNADSAQKALNMPAGAGIALLDKVIANDIEVRPGDTQAEVVTKVNRVEANL